MTKPIVFWFQLLSFVSGIGLVAMAIQSESAEGDAEAPVYAPKREPASANKTSLAIPSNRTMQDQERKPQGVNPVLGHTDPIRQKSVVEETTRGVIRPFGSVGNQNLPARAPDTQRSIFAP
jgi:hypothetical protein